MKRPLLAPALAFAAGILAGEFLGRPPWHWLTAAAVALLLTVLPSRLQNTCLWLGWAFAGGLAHSLQDTPLSPFDLRRLTGPEPRLVELRGVIAETPSLRLKERRGHWTERTLVRLDVTAWRSTDGEWSPACGRVMTATKGAFPSELFRGRPAEVIGVLQQPGGPAAPGLFNYREHLRHSGIARIVDVARVEDWRPGGDSGIRPPWSEQFLPWAQRALARGLPDDETTRLLWAMTLGWRTALSGEMDTVFMESGTMHIFAISGLHIALIAGVGVAVLRAVRIPRSVCGLIIIPILWFYVAATGWQSSAMRSALMMSAVAGTWILQRPGDLLNSLALAALVILAQEPGQLLQAGFQLSFGVVAGLALLVPVLEPPLLRRLRFNSDPFLPDGLRPPWKRAFDSPVRWLATSVATGIAAFATSLPITVHTFHLFSPVTLLANLVVVPLSGFALAANVGALIADPIWPDLAAVFNASAWIWMKGMIVLSREFARMPGGVWYVPAPAWPWWCVYGAVVAGLASGHLASRSTLRRYGLILIPLALIAAAQLTVNRRTTTLTLLPAGEAIIVDSPGSRSDLVINTGGASSGPGVVTPLLHSLGWNRTPVLALGQADATRLGDATGFLTLFRPRDVVAVGDHLRSPVYRSALTKCRELNLPLRWVRGGDSVAGWTVLSPTHPRNCKTADDGSLVLIREVGGLRVLLLAQLSRQGQRTLLENVADRASLRADIVISGLPRKEEPLDPALLEAISPRLIVITSAVTPAAQQARPKLRQRLADLGIPTFFTEDLGTLTLEIRPGRAQLRSREGLVAEVRGESSQWSVVSGR